MARRIRYTGQPVLELSEVAAWLRLRNADRDKDLLEKTLIPGVIGMCESRTGAAIAEAEYQELWPEYFASGHALDVGQATDVVSVARVGGGTVIDSASYWLEQGQRESSLFFEGARPGGVLRINYRAGIDLAAYPSVKTWLLMGIATLYDQRESIVIGQPVAELPAQFLETMLAEVTVPPRF